MSVSAEDVRNLLLSHFSEALSAVDIDAADVQDDFDLFGQGLIDSLGILEMVGVIEEHFGRELDLEELDPELLTVIGPLSRFVADQFNSAR